MSEMTLEQVVSAVSRELKIEKLFDTQEGKAAMAAVVNKALADMEQKLTSEIAEERKLRTAAEEGIAELRERIARREKVSDRDFGVRVDARGRLRPTVSRECADHLVQLFKGNRALSQGVDAEGGYLVQPEFAAEILRLIPTVGLYRRVARIVPMQTDEINFGKLASGITTYWPGENAAVTPSEPTFGQLKLTAKILAGYTEAPETLLDNATPELGQFIADLFIEGLAKEEDRVGFMGDSPTDAFDGIMFASGVVSKVLGAGELSINDVDADDLLDLQTSVPDGAREDCRYFMSPTVFDFVRKKKDSTGNYIWQAPSAGAPGTIWGKPYELSERFPAYTAADAASTAYVAYGNPKNLLLGENKALAVRSSDVAGTTFQKIQTAIRVHERIAIGSYGEAFAKLVTAAV